VSTQGCLIVVLQYKLYGPRCLLFEALLQHCSSDGATSPRFKPGKMTVYELRGINLVGNLGGGDDDRLLSGPNFLLAKLAVLKHLTQ